MPRVVRGEVHAGFLGRNLREGDHFEVVSTDVDNIKVYIKDTCSEAPKR
jgi:hypothetical protein